MELIVLAGLAGLALLDSTSFGTLVVPLVLLVQPRVRPARIVLYLATIGAFYLCLGLVLLGGAAWARATSMGVGDALSSAGLIEAASMLPYLAAIGILTTADVSFATGAAVLTGYVAVMLLPAALLLLVRVVSGPRLESPLTRLRDGVVRHTAGSLGWILGAVGVLLVLGAKIVTTVGHVVVRRSTRRAMFRAAPHPRRTRPSGRWAKRILICASRRSRCQGCIAMCPENVSSSRRYSAAS